MVYVQEILETGEELRPCVIIPSYNESSAIREIITRVKRLALDVLVVDDGSTDDTALLAETSGAIVIRNPKNLGKGASLAKGFEYCLNNEFDAAITMDGDGQHLPDDIPNFLSHAEKNPSLGMIIGNRMADLKNMPWIRVMTNRFMSWLISRVSGQKIFDSQCGFRLIKKTVLEKISLKTDKFETESEMIIEASRNGVKIGAVPIQTIYMKEHSHINPLIDTIRFFRFILNKLKR